MGFLNLFPARRPFGGRHHKHLESSESEPEPLGMLEPAESPSTFEWENAELSRALRAADAEAGSVAELLESRAPCPLAIPVLLAALPGVQDLRLKEAVARALARPEARPLAAGVLWTEFLAAPMWNGRERQVKWAIGHALGTVSDDSVFGAVETLLRDRSHGWTRTGLVYGLAHMPAHRNQVVALLLDLLEDPDCAADAVIALARLGEAHTRRHLERFLHHSDPWVRNEVRRALAKLECVPREEES